jgi:ketosteroid isomerase-like protein
MHNTIMRNLTAAALVFSAVPALAQDMDHSAHGEQSQSTQMDHSAQDMNHMDHMAAMNDDIAGAEAALTAYRDALTARDADAMTDLFAEESFVYENGKDEGSFANYMAHHLGPELDAITSFTFGEPTVAVTRIGHMAYGRETYTYRIELADGRVIDREGVATSVLTHDANGWKIVQYHSSSRAPRSE